MTEVCDRLAAALHDHPADRHKLANVAMALMVIARRLELSLHDLDARSVHAPELYVVGTALEDMRESLIWIQSHQDACTVDQLHATVERALVRGESALRVLKRVHAYV
jgi:hypothetical protein